MKLTPILAASFAAALLSAPLAYGQTTPTVVIVNEDVAALPEVQALVDSLIAEGYTNIEIRRTMLGRAKVTAEGPEGSRVVVMSSTTGEILRDISHGAEHTEGHGGEMGEGNHGGGGEMGEGNHGGGTGGTNHGGNTGGTNHGGGNGGGGMGGGMGGMGGN